MSAGPATLQEKPAEKERETDAWAALSLCSQRSSGAPHVGEAIWGVPALVELPAGGTHGRGSAHHVE